MNTKTISGSAFNALHDGHVGYLNNLAKKGWLSKQPDAFQGAIASLGRWVSVPAGTRLYSAGDPSDALIGIDQGYLDVLATVSGDEEVAFFRAGVGEWLGDGGLLFGEPRQLSLETATHARIFEVPQTSLRQRLSRNPQEWRYLFHLATNRITLTADLVGELVSLPPTVLIARQLLRLQKRDGTILSTQEDLARLLGLSRQTFRRSIQRLVDDGAVETSYGHLRLVDRAAMEQAAKY